LVYAAELLDEHTDNVYRRLSILQARLRRLNFVALAAIGGWIIVSPRLGETLPVESRTFYTLTLLLGVMGAVVSGYSLARASPGGKIPEQLQTSTLLFARLMLGAVSALALSTFVSSGVLNVGSTLSAALVTAFAAGFSEQFVAKTVDSFVSKARE